MSLKFLILPSNPLGHVCFHFVEVSQQLKAVRILDANHVTLALSVSLGLYLVWDVYYCRESDYFEIRNGIFLWSKIVVVTEKLFLSLEPGKKNQLFVVLVPFSSTVFEVKSLFMYCSQLI